MKHKLLRILVAVALVCFLVVSWSPIQVKANLLAVAGSAILNFFEAGAAAAGISVFSYVAIGLGITFGAAKLVDVVGEYIEYSGNLGAKIYYYPDGSWTYGVDLGFIDSVRAFLFDAGYLISTGDTYQATEQTILTLADGQLFSIKKTEITYSVCSYYDMSYGTTRVGELCWWPAYQSGIQRTSYYLDGTSFNGAITFVGGNEYRYYFHEDSSGTLRAPYYGSFSVGSGSRSPEKMFVTAFIEGYVSGSVLSMIEDVQVGTVAPLGIPMTEAYPEWYGNSRPYVSPGTEEEVAVLPIPYNPTADPDAAVDVLTQPDIWQGSLADPIPGIESGADTTISVTPWETFKTWISTGWQAIIQAIPTAGTIADAIGNVIKSIFVPDADFISEKWNAIRSRFDFADSITATGEVLLNILDGLDPEPPVIYIDLGAAEGSYNIGGEVPFIDLRWYAQYKPTMDMIVSAFLWLAFVWRLILKLPGIISGMPGEFVLMNLPVNLPHLGIGSGQRREELESGRNNRRLGDGH